MPILYRILGSCGVAEGILYFISKFEIEILKGIQGKRLQCVTCKMLGAGNGAVQHTSQRSQLQMCDQLHETERRNK